MTHQAESLNTGRLEAFSDGVFAILLTLMVFNIHTPKGSHFSDLNELRPVFLGYLLSFIYLVIYWNNHHHLLKTLETPNGWTMWANANLLFWLSLIPFATMWLGQSGAAKAPTVLYGFLLFMAAISYSLLSFAIIKSAGGESTLAKALGSNLKAKISNSSYLLSIGFAFYFPIISYVIFSLVAVLWIVPDRRIVREINSHHHE